MPKSASTACRCREESPTGGDFSAAWGVPNLSRCLPVITVPHVVCPIDTVGIDGEAQRIGLPRRELGDGSAPDGRVRHCSHSSGATYASCKVDTACADDDGRGGILPRGGRNRSPTSDTSDPAHCAASWVGGGAGQSFVDWRLSPTVAEAVLPGLLRRTERSIPKSFRMGVRLWQYVRERTARPRIAQGRILADSLLAIWRTFLDRQPPAARALIGRYPWVVVMGESGAGKTALIDAKADCKSQLLNDFPSYTDDPLLKLHLGRRAVIHELGPELLSDNTVGAKLALSNLWKPLCRTRPPLVVIVLSLAQLHRATPTELRTSALRLASRLKLLSTLHREVSFDGNLGVMSVSESSRVIICDRSMRLERATGYRSIRSVISFGLLVVPMSG